ncbi:winged helix-turn-helix domain-containing protein [Patescibacteria group bacterium]|nr:winged helix-turn-helix domain-containing protein [Patescibacteria group bacterium]
MNDKLLKLFTSRVRIKILTLFFTSRKPLYVRQICRAVSEEINAVRRELNRMHKIGLLKSKPKGNKLFYRLDNMFVFYPELARLVVKSTGLGKVIIERSEDLGNITYAMLALSFCKGRTSSKQEVDVFIVGRVRLRLLKQIMQNAEKEYGREVNYSVMTLAEFDFRKKRQDNFIRQVLAQPQVMLIGDEGSFNES